MYNQNNLAVGKIASASSIKPELGAIAFYPNRTVATDSFRLIEMSASGEVKGKKKKSQEPIMLHAKTVLTRVKMKKDEALSLEDIVASARAETVKGTYPDIDRVMDDAEKQEGTTVKINGKYLAEILTVLSKMDAFESVELFVPTQAYKPILLRAGNDKQKARALLMPMNR